MSKPVKNMITDAIQRRYSQLDSALWVEMLGVDGHATTEFRRSLRTKRMRLEMVKTSLFRRAVAGGKLEALSKAASGPVALITGGDSLIEVAKAVEEWMPKMKGLRLRAAVLEGEFVDEKQVIGLSKMPTKRDLQGRVASCALSPGAKLASAIRAPGGAIAGCIKALIEKLEKGETAAAAG